MTNTELMVQLALMFVMAFIAWDSFNLGPGWLAWSALIMSSVHVALFLTGVIR